MRGKTAKKKHKTGLRGQVGMARKELGGTRSGPACRPAVISIVILGTEIYGR